jgi:mycothiol synthase
MAGPSLPGLRRATGSQQGAAITAVTAAEEARTGRRAFGQELRSALLPGGPAAQWVWRDPPGRAYAGIVPGSPPTVELTADPHHPEAAPALAELLARVLPHASLWAHGDRSEARRAAQSLGLAPHRRLWLMSRAIDHPPAADVPAGFRLRPFDRERDFSAVLRLNRAAFADLPDQGSWTAADLEDRLDAPWYEPAGFLVAERDGRIVGFHWTKVDPAARIDGVAAGEVHVLAVAAEYRGTGLASSLLRAGLAHMARGGLRRVFLFVDEANAAAVRRYTIDGFDHRDTDRQYRW